MKKIKVVALIVACLMVLSGCSLFSPDEERIAQQVVAKVNDTEIHLYEFETSLNAALQGSGIDPESDDPTMAIQYEYLKSYTLQHLVEYEVMLQMAPKLGVTVSEEDKQKNAEWISSLYDDRLAQIREEVEEEAKTDDTIDVEAEIQRRYDEFVEMFGMTKEEYIAVTNEEALVRAVTDYIYAMVEVTDDEAKEAYDTKLESQKKAMDEDPKMFDTYVQKGYTYVYYPEQKIAVKHVLLKFEDQDLVTEASNLYNAGKTDEAMALLAGEIDKLMPKAQEVKERLENGESIDDLIEELGEDPGMKSGKTSETGYLIGESTEGYLQEFKDAALKLNEVEAVSEPLATYYGLHVLQCIAIHEKGPIPFEQVEEGVREERLNTEKQQKYAEVLSQWQEEFEIKIYQDRLGWEQD